MRRFSIWIFASLFIPAALSAATTLPAGFTESTIATDIFSPVSFTIAPDGRIFVCEQTGGLRVVKNGALLPTPFVSISVDATGDRGLLSVAFDPQFPAQPYVYVLYTAPTTPAHNVVVRYTADGDVAVPGSETVIFNISNLSSSTHHCTGAIGFGPDGKLYVTAADNSTGANAQNFSTLLGKVMRINADGTIPSDNPFYATASGDMRAIWAYGARDVFSFSFQPGTGRLFLNDVGSDYYEEINEGWPGANYGWPTTEGEITDGTVIDPIHYYGHGTGPTTGCAITGGTFYNPPTNQFPSTYTGKYFFMDFCSGWIRILDPDTAQTSGFATSIGMSPVYLRVGADGSLYYIARGSGLTTGNLRRIQYTPALAPSITQHPASQTAWTQDPVTFTVSAAGSSPFQYQWQRNGTSIGGATESSYTIASASLADDGMTFRCVVTNAYGTATSSSAVLDVQENNPPVPMITSPVAGTLYSAGQTMTFSGEATDPDEGTLPASAFTWQVDLLRTDHIRPYVPPVSGTKTGTVTFNDVGLANPDVFYRITLTVVDSRGQQRSVTRDVMPRLVDVTIDTEPSGIEVQIDSHTTTTPYTFTGVVGFKRLLTAPATTTASGILYTFANWSDGGAASHEIVTPASNGNFVASYTFEVGGGEPVNSGAPPVLSGPTVQPSGVVSTGQVVVFSASATGAGPMEWFWDFGGIGYASSSSVSHIFDVAGTYTVVVTVSDANGRSTSGTLSIEVLASDPSSDGSDFDGDGVSDAVEIADGTNPIDGTSFLPRTLTIKKVRAAVDSLRTGRDSLQVDGVLPGGNDVVVPLGKVLVLNVNGVLSRFVVTRKNAGTADAGALKFSRKVDRKTSAATLSFGAKLSKGTWAAQLGLGVAPRAGETVALPVNVRVTWNGRRYEAALTGDYKMSRSGRGSIQAPGKR